MIRWIVGSSIKLRFLLIVLAAMLLIFGFSQIRSMPVDVYPEFDPPLVEVQTEALGLSAAEMEALITVPLEADLLNGVAWLDQIYSETVAGMSSILLVFEPGTDPIRARQMVQERLTQTFALPNVSSPPTMLQPLSTTSRAMIVGISSGELSPIELGVLARWNIRPRLMGVPGVANVAIWGHRDRQLQVLVDPAQIAEQDVTLRQIIETTGEALWVSPLSYLESSSPGTAGWIDTPNQRLSIRHELPISSAEELSRIAIKGKDGLLLGDIADVVEDHQPLIGDAALSTEPGLLFVIEKFPNANTLEVTQGVEEALALMAPGLRGVEIDTTIFRPANYIETAISNLSTASLIGMVLFVLAVGFLFFFNWRTTVISLVVIPMSLVAATFILYLRGETFNMMILAGLVLALGVIIDNAIIDVENIARRLRQQRQEGSERPAASIVYEAVIEMRDPVFFAMLITLLIVVPLFFIPGLTGLFFQPLVVSYILAVLASLAVTLIVTPGLSMILLGNTSGGSESPLMRSLQSAYNGILAATVRTPNLALIITAVGIIVGLALIPFLGISLKPSLQQTELLIDWEAVSGTSRGEMNRITNLVTQELQSLPGVMNVGSHIGRAITGDATVGINSADLWVTLDPAADYEATVAAIEEIINGYPGLFRTVQTYEPERTAETLTGVAEDLVVRVYGDDYDLLYEQAEQVRQSIAGISGISDARYESIVEEPQVEIEVDLAAAESNRIKPGDVRRQATTLIAGLRVGNLYEENKVFDVVVWGKPEIRNDLTDINELLIHTPNGEVPLGELAEVRIAPAPIVIRRDVVSRFVDVVITVNGRNLTAVTADIQDTLRNMTFPLEYHAEVLNSSGVQPANTGRMISIVVATVLGVLLLMQAAYGSWRLALATLVTLPMALAGSVVAALLSGGVLTIGSLFGFFIVLAVAVRNRMVMISHFQHLELHEGETFGPALVQRGARERMGPILMTAVSLILLLLPLLFGGNTAGLEIVRPMAIVIIGGLITATLLNLVVTPAIYLRYGSSPEPEVLESMVVPAPTGGTD